MKIYVHTKGRATLAKGTLAALGPVTSQVTIVCPLSEKDSYAKKWPFEVSHVPDEWNLPQVQQGIIELAHYDGHKKIVMLDDDLRFAIRHSAAPDLTNCTNEDIVDMFELLDISLNVYAHATISPRQGNNRVEQYTKYVGSARSVLGFRTDILKRHNIRFDRVPSKSDYDVTLQLLRLGYANSISYNFSHDQTGGPTLPGGCTETRTADIHQKASEALHALHPDFVKVVIKEKAAWTNTGGKRHDVIVYWKKAFESAPFTGHVPPLVRKSS